MEKPHHPESGSSREFTVPGAALPFVVIGASAVVVGGLVAAVTSPVDWDHGSWVAAYLVLVVGVAQIGLGIGQSTVAPSVSDARRITELVALNLGSAAVMVGTLAGLPMAVTAGSAVLLVALVAFLKTSWEASASSWTARVQSSLLTVLVVSVPVGVYLSWIRH